MLPQAAGMTGKWNIMKCPNLVFPWGLAIAGAAGLLVWPALAHGTSTGSAGGGMALLVFPAAAILFVFFLVFTHRRKGWTVLVTGGGGYIGSVLVPKLLQQGHRVVVLDLYPDGDEVFRAYKGYENLREISGDIRDPTTLAVALKGCDAVIHLACITGRARPDSGAAAVRATNLDALGPLLRAAKSVGVKRFVFASSLGLDGSAVEAKPSDHPPLDTTSDFFAHKARCQQVLDAERAPGFITCTVRAGAVCGPAPSQRLDVGVNALARDGFSTGHIRISGGGRQRMPHIHVEDLAAFYLALLKQPDGRIDGKVCDAGSETLTLLELAEAVKAALGGDLLIEVEPGEDHQSQDVQCDRIDRDFDFEAKYSVAAAVRDLVAAFRNEDIALAGEEPGPALQTNRKRKGKAI